MHDLLTDPLIGVYTGGGVLRLSLPELLAALSAGKVEGYTGLRAHQADPWHVFLVQLAASIQAREPTDELPADTSYWREGLLDLAEGVPESWQLVVEDVTKPAFLQHPWKSWEEEAKDFRVTTSRSKTVIDPKAATPDELDVLVTSKNHDVKMARMGAELAEAWLYALMMLQTTSGFLGQGNYGIVRMNGGHASRPVVVWTTHRHPSARFVSETKALCAIRDKTCKEFGYAQRGVVLTWITRWDRQDHQFCVTKQTPLEPWFIEACRPIRLRALEGGRLIALGATSEKRQIGPKTLDNGDVGDPWTPIKKDKKKGRAALTLTAEGFTPQLLVRLIFGQDFYLTPLQEPKPGEDPGWFVASCLARGQGTTEGFHRVEIPVPAKARIAFFNPQRRDTLAHLAQGMLDDTKAVDNALGLALTVFTEGGPEKHDLKRVESWTDAARQLFAKRWETFYFPTLWRGAEEPHDTVRADWQQHLADTAHGIVNEATYRLPLPNNRRWRALTQARSAFIGMLMKAKLPLPSQSRTETEVTEEISV